MILFLLLTFFPDQVVTGTVIDADTKQPVQYATVYFANTTIGTTTDAEGRFVLRNMGTGKYDLTVSFVGYETLSYTVEVTPDATINLRFELRPSTITLPEVFVNGDRSEWLENYEIFKRHFFGKTDAAAKCEIVNTEELYFYYDTDARVMSAQTSAPLEVVNKWLGYRLFFDLQSFSIDYKSGKLEYYGIPRFEELSETPKKSWLRRREEAYYGSVMHFFRTVHNRSLNQEDYFMQELIRIPNPFRLPDSVIDNSVAELKLLLADSSIAIAMRDSASQELQYLASEKRKPSHVLVTGKVFDSGQAFIDSRNVTASGIFQVNYNGHKRRIFADGPKVYPTSRLHLDNPVQVFPNGYYEDIQSVFLDGDWSNFDTIASMLPLDYQPGEP